MKNKIKSFSYIRSLACIAIVLLHTVFSSIGLYGGNLSENQVVFYRVIINNLMWAVPLFVMVTGALLLDSNKVITYSKLWKQYILRIVLAVLVFGAIFSLCDTLNGSQGAVSVSVFLSQFAEVFTGTSWSHLWYLYCLIGLYLLLPAYKKVAKLSTDKDLEYLLAVYFVFVAMLPLLKIWNIECGFYIHVSTIYPFYLFGGYLLWCYREKYAQAKMKATEVFLFVISTVGLIVLSVLRWKMGWEYLDTLFTYSSPLVVIQAMTSYALLAQVGEIKGLGRVLEVIDRYSFGIYLIHMIFLRYLLKEMAFNPIEHGGIWCMIGIVIVLVIISGLITWLLKKIPGIRKIV